jgi:alpha-mannosidase
VTYSLIPHSGDWIEGLPMAYAFDLPLKAAPTQLHAGGLETTGKFAEVSSSEFIISAIKQTEDEKGWIVRGYNVTGTGQSLQLKPSLAYKEVMIAQMDETPSQRLVPTKSGSLDLQVDPHKIVTLRFD